jgi:hypothetical protein
LPEHAEVSSLRLPFPTGAIVTAWAKTPPLVPRASVPEPTIGSQARRDPEDQPPAGLYVTAFHTSTVT